MYGTLIGGLLAASKRLDEAAAVADDVTREALSLEVRRAHGESFLRHRKTLETQLEALADLAAKAPQPKDDSWGTDATEGLLRGLALHVRVGLLSAQNLRETSGRLMRVRAVYLALTRDLLRQEAP